jgi:hypothetical protein
MSAGGTPAGATASSSGTNAVGKANSAESARATAAATAEIQNIFKQNKNLDAQTEKTREETKNVEKYGNQLDALTLLHGNSAETQKRIQEKTLMEIEKLGNEIDLLYKKGQDYKADRLHEIYLKYIDRMGMGRFSSEAVGLGMTGKGFDLLRTIEKER